MVWIAHSSMFLAFPQSLQNKQEQENSPEGDQRISLRCLSKFLREKYSKVRKFSLGFVPGVNVYL
jgi:hypothetical protein